MAPDPDPDPKQRLLRAGLAGRGPRARPRDEGEVIAMARMARERWLDAERRGEIKVVPGGYRWDPDRT